MGTDDARTLIAKSIEHLMETARGRGAIVHLHAWLIGRGCGLDSRNQAAVLTVLEGAWGLYAGTTLDALAAADDRISTGRGD